MSDANDNQIETNRNFNDIMLKLGALQASADDTKQHLIDLNIKVGIQNGRVTKMEHEFTKQSSFIAGVGALAGVIGTTAALIFQHIFK